MRIVIVVGLVLFTACCDRPMEQGSIRTLAAGAGEEVEAGAGVEGGDAGEGGDGDGEAALATCVPPVWAACPAVGACRVMATGDSITMATKDLTGDGYRRGLWEAFPGRIDYVGTQTRGGLPDPQHEAYSGITTNGLARAIELQGLVTRERPAVVIVMIGTNDVLRGTATAAIKLDFEKMWDVVHGSAPEAAVVFSDILPLFTGRPEVDGRVGLVNTIVFDMVRKKRAIGLHAYGAGTSAGAVGYRMVASDFVDGIHPTTMGYAKVWPVLRAAVAPLLEPRATL